MGYRHLIFGLVTLLFFSFAYAPSHWDVLEQLTYSVDVDEASFDLAIVPIYTDEIKEMDGQTITLDAYWCADLNQNMSIDGVQLSRTIYSAWDAHMPSDGAMIGIDLVEGIEWEDGKRYTIKGVLQLQGIDYHPLPYRLKNIEILSK